MTKALLSLPSVACLVLLLFQSTACKKEYSYEGGPKPLAVVPSAPAIDSTITDTTLFIDFMLDGKRIFQLDRRMANNPAWTWYPLSVWWGGNLPDTVYYPNNSLKGGLGNLDNSERPVFYFMKNAYGLDLNPYRAFTTVQLADLKTGFVDSFLNAKSYSYALSTQRDTSFMNRNGTVLLTRTLLGSGIQLGWKDSTGKFWQTSRGLADQTGSYFTITKNNSGPSWVNSIIYPGYSYSTIVAANFTCKLYDDNGHMMPLTNGRFRLQIYFYLDQ